MIYNGDMKTTVEKFSDKLRLALGDGTMDIPSDFIIAGLNWAFNDLPMVPKLDKIFSKHKQFNLDAQNHYRWSLSDATGFRRISSMPLRKFYTSTGGEPCELNICYRPVEKFYEKNGLVNLKRPGVPCEYTIETEDDNVYLVFDRPLDIPVIVDYIAYGFPKPVESMEDEIEISSIAENLILDAIKAYYLHEADDYAFAADIRSYLDNKKYIEAQQMLYKEWDANARVLGEL